MDPAVTRAISLAVGHDEPFRDEELDAIVHLAVLHARGVSGLERCRSLEILLLSGYGGENLPDFSTFINLDVIEVPDSDLREIGSAANAPALHTLGVKRSFLSDISPALDCQGLRRIDVTGNPLSDTSFREVLPELRAKGVRVKASEEREWAITRALHAAGLPFAFYAHGDRHRLSRPGLTRTDAPQFGHVTVTPEELEHLLATRPQDIEALFDDHTRLGTGWVRQG